VELTGDWPLAIIATQDVACGARLWTVGGKRRGTIFVKATFSLVRGGPMRLASPAPILLGDQHHEANLERSVIAAADVAPYLPRAEVLLSGHAYAPSPSPFLPVRLAVVGSRPLVDKTLHVFGERMWLEGEQTTAPVPFTRIPLRYERASRGPVGYEENPVGMTAGSGLPVPNVIDPADPHGPAGYGPIASFWPSRRRLLRNLDPAEIDSAAPTIPDTFAWSYFHAAPPDQRCSFFEGNEWVVLEGMHPDVPRFESQLPGARAQARVYGIESTGHREVGLSADTLWLDPDRSIACVIWRGNFEIESEAALSAAQIFAGVELPGRPIPWPGSSSQMPAAPSPQPAPEEPVVAAPAPQPEAAQPPSTVAINSDVPTADPAEVAPATTPGSALQAEAEAIAAAQAQLQAQPPAEPQRWSGGATLASPGMAAQAMRSGEGFRGPDSITNVRVEVRGRGTPDMPAASPAEGIVPPSDPAVSHATMSSTVPQAPAELRSLIAKAAEEGDEAPTGGQLQPDADAAKAEPSRPMVSFDDSPTYAPDASDVDKIVAEAEEQALRDERGSEPVGVRPNPPVAMRSSKTTIRGLGEGSSESQPPPEPPPTARFAPETAKAILQADEQPTAQLAVPDVLLKLAAETTGSGTKLLDDDDTGRPTLTNMEAPTFSQVAPKSAPVHFGEVRLEVERRVREGESLVGMDLSDVDLSGFDLSGQRLTGCRFDRANLRGARLRGVDLSGASLEGADATEADLDDAILERTNFVSAKLAKSSLRRVFLTDANLTTADLTGATLDQASGLRTMFCRARLDDASMTGATLDGADFTEAQLDRANLDGALLPELRAYEVSAEGARFCRTTLRGARFDGAVLGRARFEGAHADDSIWDRCVLDGAVLDGARLVGASFTKASLREASLTRADLSEARFNRAVLAGAKLVGIDLNAVTLDGADLTGIVTEE
jgi:uncharacterized protein YjbI with pentapeptide repeats